MSKNLTGKEIVINCVNDISVFMFSKFDSNMMWHYILLHLIVLILCCVIGVKFYAKTKLQHIIKEMWKIAGSRVTNSGAFFIHGGPNTCESLIADLKPWSCSIFYAKNWEMTEYGLDLLKRSHLKIHSGINPTKKNPLVFIFCDVDKKLEYLMKEVNLDYGRVSRERSRFYNLIHDFVDIPIFPNTILIMISNKHKAYLDILDPAYLRKGRVDKCWDITSDKIYVNNLKEKDE